MAIKDELYQTITKLSQTVEYVLPYRRKQFLEDLQKILDKYTPAIKTPPN